MNWKKLCKAALPVALTIAAVYGLYRLAFGIGPIKWGPNKGVSFRYDRDYEKTEKQMESDRYQITIKTPEKPTPENVPREGSPAITIDIYDNVAPGTPVLSWLEQEPRSNYNLAIAPAATTTVAGNPGLQYTWDGLYRGDSKAVPVNGKMYVFSVTYLDSSSDLRREYEKLVGTVRFQEK